MRKPFTLAAGLFAAALLPTACTSPSTATAATAAAPTDVLGAANAFLATLSAEQRQQVVVGFNATNAAKWSNFPCGLSCREGLLLQSLTPAQRAAALAVVRAATGTVAGEGFDEIQQLRAADDNLAAVSDNGPPSGGPGLGAARPVARPLVRGPQASRAGHPPTCRAGRSVSRARAATARVSTPSRFWASPRLLAPGCCNLVGTTWLPTLPSARGA